MEDNTNFTTTTTTTDTDTIDNSTQNKKKLSSSLEEVDDDQRQNQSQNQQNLLDTKYYYYQNPISGQVNSTPLSVRQLIKLFCPIRLDMKPILPNHTQCLLYTTTTTSTATTQSEATNEEEKEEYCWNVASNIDILKESSSTQWYISIPTTNSGNSNDASSTTTTTKGPMSCRGVFEEIQSNSKQLDRIMIYEPNFLKEWTLLRKNQSLQSIFESLLLEQQQQHNERTSNQQQVDDSNDNINASSDQQPKQQEIQDELDAFLSSTEVSGSTDTKQMIAQNDNKDVVDEHTYESDGGTKYIKDPFSGNWIHEALAPNYNPNNNSQDQKQQGAATSSSDQTINKKKKKKNKSQFSKRNARNWIYVTGLPTTTQTTTKDSEDEAVVNLENVARFFGKVGLLDLDPQNLQPKIKLYYDSATKKLKGDASICYAHPQSVELALQILDDSLWYDNKSKIKVEHAKFEAKGGSGGGEDSNDGGEHNTDGAVTSGKKRQHHKRVHISEAKRKVARLALKQAQDEGFGGRLSGGRKGLCIIVIKNMMEGVPENKLESTIYSKCEEFGTISKITVIESTKVIIVKFVEPTAASMAIEKLSKEKNSTTQKRFGVKYWDGVTDYTHDPSQEETLIKDEEKRHEEFGNWLEETQRDELPEELRLRVET